MMWRNKTRLCKTAKVPHAYISSEEDPLVLITDLEGTRSLEIAVYHLNEGQNCSKVPAWLVEKNVKKNRDQTNLG